MSLGPVGLARLHGAAGRLLVMSAALLLGACAGSTDDDGTANDPDGLGDPCSTDDTVGALCLVGLVCVEPTAGAGGACAQPPIVCAAVASFCDCDLASLCDGPPALCFDVDGSFGVVCE